MILTQKSSVKRMIHSFSKTQDIKSIKFSHNQKLMLTSDVLHQTIKLWDVQKQQELYSFTTLPNSPIAKNIQKLHDMTFTPDDQNIIILGEKTIHVYNISSLVNNNQNINNFNTTGQVLSLKRVQEIYRIQGTTGLGTGQTSLDNLYYIYTNASQVNIRDLSNMQLLQNYIDKNHYHLKDMKDQLCQPYYLIVSKYENNVFYTSSDLNGKICKWTLKNKQNSSDKSYPVRFYPQLSLSLNATINQIDQTDQLLIISHVKGRKILALNKNSFQIVSQNSLKNLDDFLDINQRAISTYSYSKNIILSGVQKGQYLFYLNGSTLKTISKSKLQINAYAIQCNQKFDFVAIGSEQRVNLANGSSQICDQTFFYQNKLNCGQILNTFENVISNGSTLFQNECFCQDAYSWSRKTNECLKLNCLISKQNKNACSCNINPKLTQQNDHKIIYQWNPYAQYCQINCSQIENAIKRSSNYLPEKQANQCSCQKGFRWNPNLFSCQKASCSFMQGSNGRLNKTLNLNTCGCNQKFSNQKQNPLLQSKLIFQNQCILDCSSIENSISSKQSSFNSVSKKQFCSCNQNAQWNFKAYQCYLKITPQSKPLQNNGTPIIIIIIPILLLVAIIGYCCYRGYKAFKNEKKKKYETQSQTDTIGTNNDVKSTKYMTKSSIKRQKQKQKEQLNLAINNQIVRNYQPTFSVVDKKSKKDKINVGTQNSLKVVDQKLDKSNSAQKRIRKNIKLNNFLNSSKQYKKYEDYQISDQQQYHQSSFQNQPQLQSSRPVIAKPLIQKKQETDQDNQKRSSIKDQNKFKRAQQKYLSKNKTCQLCYIKGCDSITKCKHYFHYVCIKKQLQEDNNPNKQCPSCWSPLQKGLDDVSKITESQKKIQTQQVEKKQIQ